MDTIRFNKAKLEMVLQRAQGLCALITFVTVIATSDFDFFVSYTILVVYAVFILDQKKVALSLKTTAIMDVTGSLFIFMGTIWLIASKVFTYDYASSFGGAYSCVVFLIVGAIIQATAVHLACVQLYHRRDTEEPTTIKSTVALQ
ncbi:hypothetical protein ACHHYP_14423 [Achlya hypogyna]|uniref:Uncharacterized protein n=1 Tax=Achlya hypogyna TaxID=1202772 RepID=A0A1V9YD44_ACHHY|nr:hypothetical protein ACHHYP_14423 [Achlya hypogyna]